MIDVQTQYPGLIEAMMIVESANEKYPKGDPCAIGDRGLKYPAFGCLQIRQPYMTDALGYGRKAEELLGDVPLSIKVVNMYMSRYATKGRIGRVPTAEDIARIHNGGPNGYKSPGTEGYWDKVLRHYQN